MAAGKAWWPRRSRSLSASARTCEVAFTGDAKFTADGVVARVVARFDFGWNDVRGARLVQT